MTGGCSTHDITDYFRENCDQKNMCAFTPKRFLAELDLTLQYDCILKKMSSSDIKAYFNSRLVNNSVKHKNIHCKENHKQEKRSIDEVFTAMAANSTIIKFLPFNQWKFALSMTQTNVCVMHRQIRLAFD